MQPISIFPPDTIGMASKFIDDLLDRPALGSEMPDDALKELERDGLTKAFPEYAAQVALYQAYLDVTNPALFTALNADTCERMHFLVPFDAERAQAASDRAVTIIAASRAGQLLPRFTDDADDWRCRMCSHWERCWKESRD